MMRLPFANLPVRIAASSCSAICAYNGMGDAWKTWTSVPTASCHTRPMGLGPDVRVVRIDGRTLSKIQRSQNSQVLGGETESEDIQVLCHSLPAGRLGDRNESQLDVPPKKDL